VTSAELNQRKPLPTRRYCCRDRMGALPLRFRVCATFDIAADTWWELPHCFCGEGAYDYPLLSFGRDGWEPRETCTCAAGNVVFCGAPNRQDSDNRVKNRYHNGKTLINSQDPSTTWPGHIHLAASDAHIFRNALSELDNANNRANFQNLEKQSLKIGRLGTYKV